MDFSNHIKAPLPLEVGAKSSRFGGLVQYKKYRYYKFALYLIDEKHPKHIYILASYLVGLPGV